MAIPADKSQRNKAKAENLYIVQLSIDGKYREPKEGGFALTGPYAKDMVDELRAWYVKWSKRGRI